MATYVNVTLEQEELVCPDGSKRKLIWRRIPRDCADRKLRGMRPGSFALHPDEDIVFVMRGGKINPWEKQT